MSYLVLLLSARVLIELVSAQQTTIYASGVNGRDDNSGTSPDQPVRSIQKALDQARTTKAASVQLSGRFRMEQTATVGVQHGFLRVEQWPGKEAAVLSGGIDVAANATAPSSSAATWTLPLSSVAAAALSHAGAGDIFVDGRRRSVVRSATLHWEASLGPKNSEISKWGFVYAEGDIDPNWSLNRSKSWRVAAFHSWTKAYHTVARVFPHNRTLLFREPASFGYGDYTYCSKQRYYLEGVPELPLTPGSWRVVTTSDGAATLEYAPLPSERWPASVVVPVLDTLLRVANAPSVVLRNFAVDYAFGGDCGSTLGIACDRDAALMAPAALSVMNSPGVQLTNLTFHNVGGFAVSCTGSDRVAFQRLASLGSGAGGLFARSCPHMLVNNSIVRGFGLRFPAAAGVTVQSSANSTVSHCDVSDGLSTGLSGGGTNDEGAFTTFTLNHVHGLGSEDDDGICDFGGYHGGTAGSVLPLYMTSNIFHNITAFANGGSGVYMDVSSTAWQVSRNLIFDVTNSPLKWNVNPGVPQVWREGAVPTRVVNNVFVADRDNAYYRDKAQSAGAGLGNPVVEWSGYVAAVFERNVMVVDASSAPSRGSWWGGKPCAADLGRSSNCSYDLADNLAPVTIGSNVWFNRTAAPRNSATFPGGCAVTASACGTAFGECACRTWAAWTASGKDYCSRWMLDPKLSGALQLVSAPEALALGVEPLTELASAGADWAV